MNCFQIFVKSLPLPLSSTHAKRLPGAIQPLCGEAPNNKSNLLQISHHPIRVLPRSPTPRPPIRRITRPPTQKRSTRFDWRATHARVFMQAALAAVPFGSILVRVRAHWEADCMRPCASFPPSSGSTAMPIFCAEWLSTQERWDPEVSIMFGAAARYRRA